MAPIRVAQVATGNAGMLTLRQLINDARFELVAVSTSTPEKVGKDAGELAGLGVTTGITAVGDLDALIATAPACVVYCAMGDTRPVEATNDVRKLLEAGIDVVGSAPGTLQFPWGTMPEKVIEKVEASAQAGGASIYITGVDPGFASDLIPLALASTCQRIEQIKCYELADYATYDGAEVMFDLMGFGHPVDSTPLLFLPGVLGLAWGTAIRMMGSALGIEVDEIVEFWEAEPAPETYEIAAGTIEKGTIAALHFSISGMVDGHPAIVVEHVTRTRDDLRPDWARPPSGGGAYRVEITGEPNYVVDIVPSSEHGDHNHAAIVAACGRIVNAIPDVVAAAPGIRTTLELPLPTGHGTYVAPTR
ncbi:diacylglycerol kinase [Nocardioides marmoriginsengisoli]|uniref:Diacylglycerol kinase n=1 Tax=Nocardioides marmoriginsengisoli TaxID=661483 RepID=A0A3N0CLI6_9ACTN|nr:diacylglycerol kinase [Nocardioides marmoriginsengisoli]RNL64302.1 diacylglycerol kinase [Nocardioides marmoriginsengisoli]